jgi:hypothetical protein
MYFIASISRYTLLCGCRTLEKSLSLSLSLFTENQSKRLYRSQPTHAHTHAHNLSLYMYSQKISRKGYIALSLGTHTHMHTISLYIYIFTENQSKRLYRSQPTYAHTHIHNTRKTNQSSLTFELDEHKAHYVFVCRRNIIATSLTIYSENQTYNPKNVEDTHITQIAPDFVSLLTNRKILMVFCMRNVFTWHLRFELRM